jgi:hypothetical protein
MVSNWTAAGACTASCDGGLQAHVRYVTRSPAHGGLECGDLVTLLPCNTHSCLNQCPTGFIWSPCPRICTSTCDNPNVSCSTNCSSPRCECPSGTFLHKDMCVKAEQCPTPRTWQYLTHKHCVIDVKSLSPCSHDILPRSAMYVI